MTRSQFFITVTVMLGVFMAIVDMTIVNVALPTIAGNLGCSLDDAAWVATGYILAAVIVMPLNGWLTAYLGRKTFYCSAIAIFTFASFLCGMAHNIVLLTVCRMLQGLGGGVLQPTAQAILFETFGPKRSAGAMAIFGLGIMVAPALGPVMGGYIVDNASWPLIFFINLPVGIVTFLMALAFIPTPHYIARARREIDWPALGLLAVGLISLQYVLERGQHEDWWSSNTIVTLAIVTVVALAIFGIKTARDRSPLVNLKIFRIPSFSLGNVILFVLGFGLFGSELIVPLFFQTILGMTALDSGEALVPGAIATAVAMIVTTRLVNKIDARILLVLGALCAALANWQLGGLTESAGMDNTFWPRTLIGFGMGLLFVPLTQLMLSKVPREELAGATGLSQLIRQLGGSLGIAIITTLLTRETAIAWSGLAGGITQTHGASIATLTSLLSQAASVSAFDYIFRLCALLFIAAIPLIAFVQYGPPARTAESAAPMAEAA
ncbi:MAG TPA: DHA2 family efflux MFS transporter permease subunit [Candidatus Baltobacteraceae bacterium]|nr:DHA2 family efflux MFS transporter permease subunit [Candidatus Baltobacteraceae bacterium]